MSAKKTGGSAGRIKAKNQAQAAAMKAQGIVRKTCACPICHNLIAINNYQAHTATCGGR